MDNACWSIPGLSVMGQPASPSKYEAASSTTRWRTRGTLNSSWARAVESGRDQDLISMSELFVRDRTRCVPVASSPESRRPGRLLQWPQLVSAGGGGWRRYVNRVVQDYRPAPACEIRRLGRDPTGLRTVGCNELRSWLPSASVRRVRRF